MGLATKSLSENYLVRALLSLHASLVILAFSIPHVPIAAFLFTIALHIEDPYVHPHLHRRRQKRNFPPAPANHHTNYATVHHLLFRSSPSSFNPASCIS